jgi:hypothetical protein
VDTVASFYNTEITPDDVRREFMALFGPTDVPVVVIDEFNKIISKDTKILVANTLKSLSDFGVNVTIIIVGVADNVAELVEGHTSLPRCIEQVPMRRMDEAERREVLEKRVPRLGLAMDEDAAARIVQLSRGLPSYVHALGLYCVESAVANRSLRIVESDVDYALKRTIEKSSESIQDDYAEATQSNRKDSLHREVLLACALAETDDRGYFTPLSVCRPLTRVLKRGKKIVPISTFQGHLKKFITPERASILDRKGRERAYRFRFRDPMMQPFVIMKGIETGDVNTEIIDALSSP